MRALVLQAGPGEVAAPRQDVALLAKLTRQAPCEALHAGQVDLLCFSQAEPCASFIRWLLGTPCSCALQCSIQVLPVAQIEGARAEIGAVSRWFSMVSAWAATPLPRSHALAPGGICYHSG